MFWMVSPGLSRNRFSNCFPAELFELRDVQSTELAELCKQLFLNFVLLTCFELFLQLFVNIR